VGGWIGLYNDELHKLYVSPNNVRAIILRRTRWIGYVAQMGDMKYEYQRLVGKPECYRPFRRPSVDGRIILEWILRK
jgi:hypothetical protein